MAPTATITTSEEVSQLASRLRLVLARLGRRLRQETSEGLSPSMLAALSTLERSPGLTLGELAIVERVKPSSVTVMVGRMEEAGLVSRQLDPVDRRVTHLELSPKGRRLLERHRSAKTAYLTRRLRRVDPHDLEVLTRATQILERFFEDER
jgi:DNA-binding MarR family transcriptional regulator